MPIYNDDFTTIQAGSSLKSYTPSWTGNAFIQSLRIDNPTGCWYQISNNRQIIPPFTYGLVVALPAGTRSLTINFMASFAGQQSKLVGNPVQVFMTDQLLPATNPLPITSSIPYVNTFYSQDVGPCDITNVPLNALISIFPKVGMRIRITSVDIRMGSSGATISDLIFNVSTITGDGGGTLVTPVSQDGDASIVSQCFVRQNMPSTGANPPGLAGGQLRSIPMFVDNTLAHSHVLHYFDDKGPDMPPTAYGLAGGLRGLALAINGLITFPSIIANVGWTEEPILT